jgi:hypothetical protein
MIAAWELAVQGWDDEDEDIRRLQEACEEIERERGWGPPETETST